MILLILNGIRQESCETDRFQAKHCTYTFFFMAIAFSYTLLDIIHLICKNGTNVIPLPTIP